MDLENKKRVVAAALAGAAAVAPSAGIAQEVKGGRFDSTAPVVAIEDIRAFLTANELAEATRGAAMRKESDECYKPGVAQAGAPAGGAVKTPDAKQGGKYAGKSLQELNEAGKLIRVMPEKTDAERAAKLKEEQELQAATQVELSKMFAGQKQQPGATFVPVVPMPGGKRGNAITDAVNKQQRAASDPNIAACLADVEARHDDKSTPLQRVYEDSLFKDAGRILDSATSSSRVASVVLSDGARYNVVKKNGPYSSRIMELEPAMKIAARTRDVAPDYENQGRSAGARGDEKSSVELLLDAAKRAAEAAKATQVPKK